MNNRHLSEGAQRAPRVAAAEKGVGEVAVSASGLGKVFIPSPPMMRVLLRSAIKEPVVALDDVSFEVRSGEICAIVGPNGAGKSTLFRILTGLIAPTTGTAHVKGHDVDRDSLRVRRLIGFHAADERSLLLRHSCAENLMFHGRLQGVPERALKKRCREVLELVDLERTANRLALGLSTGMKARLMLARALLPKPRVLILDEPTGSLDPVAAYDFVELLRRTVAEEGIATLISSHRLEEIEALPEHVLLLNQGKLVYDGNLDALRRYWDQRRLEIRFSSSDDATVASQVLQELEAVEVLSVNDDAVLIVTELAVSDLFVATGGRLPRVLAMGEVRVPLRDLLAELLSPAASK